MKRPKTLSAFTRAQRLDLHRRLASRVAFMMGRKFEEADWADVYCAAKAIPNRSWSNLNIDIMSDGLGVEHKMLRVVADQKLLDLCGTRLMHPAATRAIRIPAGDDPNRVMDDVLRQYADLIRARRSKVEEDAAGRPVDMRVGWLLWQASLAEFLYFEEEMLEPDPADYFAEWRESKGGTRKGSRNLWVFERDTEQKRFSITTVAGAKIQPYFDVPPPRDPNLYFFRVQGEELESGFIRIWILASTARELAHLVGELTPSSLGLAIAAVAIKAQAPTASVAAAWEATVPIELDKDSYLALSTSCVGVSDQHMVQLLVEQLSANAGG